MNVDDVLYLLSTSCLFLFLLIRLRRCVGACWTWILDPAAVTDFPICGGVPDGEEGLCSVNMVAVRSLYYRNRSPYLRRLIIQHIPQSYVLHQSVESNRIESDQIKSNQIKSNRIESNRIKSNRIESSNDNNSSVIFFLQYRDAMSYPTAYKAKHHLTVVAWLARVVIIPESTKVVPPPQARQSYGLHNE